MSLENNPLHEETIRPEENHSLEIERLSASPKFITLDCRHDFPRVGETEFFNKEQEIYYHKRSRQAHPFSIRAKEGLVRLNPESLTTSSFGRGREYREGIMLPFNSDTTPLYFEDGRNEYLSLPRPPKGEVYVLPEGWQSSVFIGVLQRRKSDEPINVLPKLTTIPREYAHNFEVAWASEDPKDDRVLIDKTYLLPTDFVRYDRQEISWDSANKSSDQTLRDRLKNLEKKYATLEQLGITLENVIARVSDDMKAGKVKSFPSGPNKYYLTLPGSCRLYFPELVLQPGYVRLDNSQPPFTLAQIVEGLNSIASDQPEGEIDDEMKALLIRQGAPIPEIPSCEQVRDYISKKYAHRDVIDQGGRYYYYDTTGRNWHPVILQEDDIQAIKELRNSALQIYRQAFTEYPQKVKEFIQKGYGVRWIGRCPITAQYDPEWTIWNSRSEENTYKKGLDKLPDPDSVERDTREAFDYRLRNALEAKDKPFVIFPFQLQVLDDRKGIVLEEDISTKIGFEPLGVASIKVEGSGCDAFDITGTFDYERSFLYILGQNKALLLETNLEDDQEIFQRENAPLFQPSDRRSSEALANWAIPLIVDYMTREANLEKDMRVTIQWSLK
jgi:hypothetical protein